MIRRLLSSQLRTNMASGMVASLVTLATFAAAYPIYLHTLGYARYGVWLLLMTVLEFAQLVSASMAPAVAKLVAEEYGRRNLQGVQRYVTTAMAVLGVTGLAVGGTAVACRGAIIAAFGLTGEDAAAAAALLPYIGALAPYAFLVQALAATVSGLGRMDLSNYAASASAVVGVGLSVGLVLTGGGLESLVIGVAASYGVTHLASVFFVRRVAPLRFLRAANLDGARLRRLLLFTAQVAGGSAASLLFSPLNKLLLARYAGPGTIPVYDIAFTGSMRLRNIIESGFRALMPEVSLLESQGSVEARDRIRAVYRRSLRLVGALAPAGALLVVFARPLLALWLGEDVDAALPTPVRIMLVGTYLSLLCVPAYYTLMGLGRVRHCLGAHAVQAAANFVVVAAIIAATGALSVEAVACAVTTGMAAACSYLLWQQHLTGRAGRRASLKDAAPLAVGLPSEGGGPAPD